MNTGYHLTLLIGPTVPVPVPKPVLEALDSVEVHTVAGERSGFEISFKVSQKSVLHTLLSVVPAQVPWLRVMIIVTIAGTPHVLTDGLITQQRLSPGSQPGESTFAITGEDLSVAMDQQEFSGLPYPAMPHEARVALIVAKYAMFGMIPMVIPAIFKDVAVPVERYPSHQGTDLGYLTQLADEVGHVFYVEPGPLPGMNTAYWGPQIKVGVPQPALNSDMDFARNTESMSFEFNNTQREMPVIFIQNPQTKAPIPIPIPDIGPLNPPLGAVSPLPSKFKFMKETAKLSPMAALGKGIAAAAGSADAVTGSGSLDVTRYGHLLKARGLVGVRGVGPSFDGLYYVKKVTSTLKRGEFKQNFSLTRNGLVSITPAVPI